MAASVGSSPIKSGMTQGTPPQTVRARTYFCPMIQVGGSWPGTASWLWVAMPMIGRGGTGSLLAEGRGSGGLYVAYRRELAQATPRLVARVLLALWNRGG